MVTALILLLGFAEADLKKKLGCDEGCQIVSIEKVKVRDAVNLAVRTRRTGHCGTVSDWTLLDQSLKLLLTIDEEIDRSCSGHEEHKKTRVIIDKQIIRAGDRSWKWNGERFTGTGSP